MTEKKQRTYTNESIKSVPQQSVMSIDPLVQSIDNDSNDSESIFCHPEPLETDDEETMKTKRTRCLKRFSGIFYALLGSFFFTCSNFALKQFNVVLFDILILRYVIHSLMSIGYIVYKGYPSWSEHSRWLILVRSLCAGSGSVSYYLGLSLLPMADLTTIGYTQVIWTAVLSMFIFRERIRLPMIFASILTLTGVICVAQPTFIFPSQTISRGENRFIGMICATSCAICISMGMILSKKLLQRKVRESAIMVGFQLVTLVLMIIHQIYYWFFSPFKPATLKFRDAFLTRQFVFASMVAVLQILPMILVQKSVKREHPSIVTVVQASDIIFAIILENIFTSLKSNVLALIGALLVIVSILIVGGHKIWIDRQRAS